MCLILDATRIQTSLPPVHMAPFSMAQLSQNFNFPLPPLVLGTVATSSEDTGKRNGFDEWEGSSPSHSESESSRSSQSAPNSRASLHEDENVATAQNNVHEPLTVSTETPQISLDAKFHSYKQFEEVFEAWKKEQYHPFRVASSETLKEPDGTVNPVFKYRYVVYHCAHYGEPRMRGIGKRPNQTYLPCGCRAMLRVNYNFQERVLKITTLEATHTGHDQSAEVYNKATVKSRSSLSPVCLPPSHKRAKRGTDSSFSSPLSIRNSPANSSTTSVQNSPAATGSPASVAIQNALLLQQQHSTFMNAIFNQQKENISQLSPGQMTPQQLQFALNSLQRPQLQQNPSILNMINQLSMPLFNLPQPAHGVVAPQPAVQMKTHTEQANDLIDVVNDFSLPANLPAPKPIKREVSPPPVLERVDLETLKPAVLATLPVKTELLHDESTDEQRRMTAILEEMSTRVKMLSSGQILALLPQLETLLTLFKQ